MGVELKQGEREELILFFRGCSQQARDLEARSVPTLLPMETPWAAFA